MDYLGAMDVDRRKLKEERRLRNQEKRKIKQLEKQKSREVSASLLKVKSEGCNVSLITKEFAERVTGSNRVPASLTDTVPYPSYDEFPSLSEVNFQKIKIKKESPSTEVIINKGSKSRRSIEIGIADLLTAKRTVVKVEKTLPKRYEGNPLDSSLPERKRGKQREFPKEKKISKLKQGIIKDSGDGETNQKLENPRPLQLCSTHNIPISEELNDYVKAFISVIVSSQEKLYKQDPIKGKSKRRYVVGFHELKKYLNLNKVKLVVIPTDVKITKSDDTLDTVIKEIVNIASTKQIPYIFALKRRLIGKLTMKFLPINCIGILNCEGFEQQLAKLLELYQSLKLEDEQDSNDTINEGFLNKLMEAIQT